MAVKDNVAGLFGGSHKSKKYGSSCEFADYRKYIEGDDITKIDWNIYGRFEELYIKLYLDEKQMNTRIYIDTSRSMSFYNKSNFALRLATTLAYLSVSEMDRVSIYTINGHRVEPLFEKIVGKERFLQSVSSLNKIKFGGDSFISDAIIKSQVGYGDGKSIIISDFLTDNNYFDAIDYLRQKRRDVLCIQLLANEEINPNARGKSLLYDCEDSDRFYKGNVSRDILKAYTAALEYIKDNLSHFCASREADYIFYPTSMPMRELFLDKMISKGVIK